MKLVSTKGIYLIFPNSSDLSSRFVLGNDIPQLLPRAVSEVVVKPGSSVNIEIPASETRDLFLSLIHEQGETKASEDDTQSSKVFVKLITGAK
ncbi:hypothetical protein Bca4012_087242 [Brassica carinata]